MRALFFVPVILLAGLGLLIFALALTGCADCPTEPDPSAFTDGNSFCAANATACAQIPGVASCYAGRPYAGHCAVGGTSACQGW